MRTDSGVVVVGGGGSWRRHFGWYWTIGGDGEGGLIADGLRYCFALQMSLVTILRC